MGVGFHIGGVVLVIAPHPESHGDQCKGDGRQQSQSHPPVNGKHGGDHHQGQQDVGTEFRNHVGQGRLNVLDPVHDGALHGADRPGLHLSKRRPHKPVRCLEAQTLQDGVGGHMSQHGGQGVARHLDGVARQAHAAPEQNTIPVRLPLQKQPDDLIDAEIRHKAARHTEDGQHHRGGHLPPAGRGEGQQDAEPGSLLHTQHSSQRKIVVVCLH
ncbi:unknown [Firmicutes bacterium CAG:94]|nr:unknown [Firmicutes bacterium CAG:94]